MAQATIRVAHSLKATTSARPIVKKRPSVRRATLRLGGFDLLLITGVHRLTRKHTIHRRRTA